MAERLRVWLTGGHECDLDLGEGSAQDLMEKVENAGDRIVVFNLLTGRFADNRLAIGLKGNVTLGFEFAQRFTNSKCFDLQRGCEFSQFLKKKLCQ